MQTFTFDTVTATVAPEGAVQYRMTYNVRVAIGDDIYEAQATGARVHYEESRSMDDDVLRAIAGMVVGELRSAACDPDEFVVLVEPRDATQLRDLVRLLDFAERHEDALTTSELDELLADF